MPTNEERKKVARSLREISEHSASYFALAEVVGTCEPDDMPGAWDSTIRRIADLIEPDHERTCKREKLYDAGGVWYEGCSKCRNELKEHDVYCSKCGAKVVG